MKVVWVVPSEALQTGPGGLGSNLASLRYRALIPMRGLRVRGHDASVVGLDRNCADEVRRHIADADRLVFIKNYGDPVCSETVLDEQRARGVKTWFDLTDDRFQEVAGEHLRHMVDLADNVVTVSPTLRDIIHQQTGRDSSVVGDPYEGPRGAPRWSPAGARVKALWFGYGWNIPALFGILPALEKAGSQHPLDLEIVTDGVENLDRYCEKFNRQAARAVTLTHTKWSLEETWRALAVTDFVLIPARLDKPWTLAKSPNRIIEALWAGRFVVAHPIPSYLEFGGWAWLGDDLVEGIAWMMNNQDAIGARVAAAQEHIVAAYSPESIAGQWESILDKT